LEQSKILADYEEVLALIISLKELLGDDDKITDVIEMEIQEILTSYGDERRTIIKEAAQAISIEDLTEKKEVIVTITHKGYLKWVPADTYKTQKRGGAGVKGNSGDEDFYTDIFTANTHDILLFFTDAGKMFSRKVYEIPEGTRTSKGKNIVNILPISSDEKIKAILVQPRETEDKHIVFVTEHGLIKKSHLSDYENIRPSGLKAIKLIEGDNIVNVGITETGNDILLAASSGKFIRFSEKAVKPKGRVSQGSRGISLFDGEKVVGMEIITGPGEILSITEKGYGKRTDISQYRQQSRGGKGVLGMRLTLKNGPLAAIKFVSESDDLVIITNAGQVIKTKMSEVSVLNRSTQGVRIIRLKKDEQVVSVENISDVD
jgi:DNA gyrase subunit A